MCAIKLGKRCLRKQRSVVVTLFSVALFPTENWADACMSVKYKASWLLSFVDSTSCDKAFGTGRIYYYAPPFTSHYGVVEPYSLFQIYCTYYNIDE